MNTKLYYDVTMNDYEYFEWLIQSKNLEKTRNPIAVQSQQIVEKLLRYILEELRIAGVKLYLNANVTALEGDCASVPHRLKEEPAYLP